MADNPWGSSPSKPSSGGREWDVQDPDLKLLVEALMAKQDMKEYQYAYVDLLNVATFLQDRRKVRRR